MTTDTLLEIANVMRGEEEFAHKSQLALPALERLLARPDLLTIGIARTGFHVDRSSWLYFDPDIAVTIGFIKAGQVVPIHNHGTWEIVAPYRGRVTYTAYERADDGQTPGHAQLEVASKEVLYSGQVALCPPPPHDVHGWTVDEDTYLLAVVGPGLHTRREYYEPGEQRYLEKEAQWPNLLA
ncbi:MAG: hypothetical protein GEU78_16640 [Actinobacteria bacterium]|nr:hypothetical protein [Actinomycetota bacterium]